MDDDPPKLVSCKYFLALQSSSAHNPKAMPSKSTSIDIAYLAGVSQSTVSRALRGSPTVSEETRKRIEEIAQKLNYAVDKNASNLRSQHSNTIALLFFEDPTSDDSLINSDRLTLKV